MRKLGIILGIIGTVFMTAMIALTLGSIWTSPSLKSTRLGQTAALAFMVAVVMFVAAAILLGIDSDRREAAERAAAEEHQAQVRAGQLSANEARQMSDDPAPIGHTETGTPIFPLGARNDPGTPPDQTRTKPRPVKPSTWP